LAMGLNESAGYIAVALAALGTGYLAQAYGLRPEPFYLGIACAAAGLALALLFVRETWDHAALEGGVAAPISTHELFARTLWRDPALSSVSHAGLINNLNDGLAWGLFPLFFAAAGLDVARIGILSFIYPAVWGLLQLWTGALSDRWGRKRLIASGMLLQGGALAAVSVVSGFWPWMAASAMLGAGTAMVYPTLLAAVGDVAHPSWRGSAVGVYRLWRDSGYAVGALLAGGFADLFGMAWAIGAVAILTATSGLVVAVRMPETLRSANLGAGGVSPGLLQRSEPPG
jgi:MFS family permease